MPGKYKAQDKYKAEKTRLISFRLYPGDKDISDWLDAQPNRAGYIKDIIRADLSKKSQQATR